jgi:hypothetical protein
VKTKQLWKPYGSVMALLLLPATGKADVVQDWNAIMQAIVSTQTPFPQARFAAITQLAVFEAVNAITHGYQPYLGTIQAPGSASAEAAAATAAHDVLKNYFPTSAATLDVSLANSLAAIPDGPAKAAGIAAGRSAAAAMIAARAKDGSSPAAFYLPPSTDPGIWQPTPSCTAAGGAFFQWRDITPFGLRSGSQFRLGPPPTLASDRYTRAFNEVESVGGIDSTQRPADRANVARYYAVAIPVGIFNDIARQLSTAQGKSLSENAHDFALINMAISDAAVATFDSKYHYNFWRPETAIRNAANDGNDRTMPNFAFAPFITTPCFPGYPSAHAVLSNAAREILEQVYTGGQLSITLTSPAVPGVTLNYTSLTQITDDIDDARVYSGIHFRTDQDAGSALGRRVGQYIYNHILLSVHNGCAAGR